MIGLGVGPLWCVSVFSQTTLKCATALSCVLLDSVRVKAVSSLLCVRDSHLGGEQSVGPVEIVQPSLSCITHPVLLILLVFFQEGARGSRVRLLNLGDTVTPRLGHYCGVSCSFGRRSLRSDSLVDDLPFAAFGLFLEVRVRLHFNLLLLLECHCSPKTLRDVPRVDFLQREFLLDQGVALLAT